jgi:hypothetical protein
MTSPFPRSLELKGGPCACFCSVTRSWGSSTETPLHDLMLHQIECGIFFEQMANSASAGPERIDTILPFLDPLPFDARH